MKKPLIELEEKKTIGNQACLAESHSYEIPSPSLNTYWPLTTSTPSGTCCDGGGGGAAVSCFSFNCCSVVAGSISFFGYWEGGVEGIILGFLQVSQGGEFQGVFQGRVSGAT